MRPIITVRPVAAEDSALFDWERVARSIAYPEFARRAGFQGTVRVSVTAGPPGRLVGLRLISEVDSLGSSRVMLTEAALKGLAAGRFVPDPAAETTFEADVEFRLGY